MHYLGEHSPVCFPIPDDAPVMRIVFPERRRSIADAIVQRWMITKCRSKDPILRLEIQAGKILDFLPKHASLIMRPKTELPYRRYSTITVEQSKGPQPIRLVDGDGGLDMDTRKL